MIFATMFLITALSSVGRTPLLNLYLEAVEQVEAGMYDESTVGFDEIFTRMPDNNRAVYNHVISCLVTGDLSTADSLLSIFPDTVFMGDTLIEARSSARLGNAMTNNDYAGVQSVVEMLLPVVSSGESSTRIRQNYEVALKWLMQNEPPPPEENQQESEDNEDQQDEKQDENENQENGEDENNSPEKPDNTEEDQPPPPTESEMTPEVAEMILDMVEEAQADTADTSVDGAIGVPNW